jgi:hypothetical protein
MPYKDVEKRKLYDKKRTRIRRKKIKDWFEEYKSRLVCERCGFDNPVCLDFHHKNPNNKIRNVCVMSRKGWSIKKILEEIAKCEVLCANCHRIRHYELWIANKKENTGVKL